MIFLGLDIGSSGCKCVALSENGALISSASSEYPKQPGQVGLDAEELFSHVCQAIAGCARQVTIKDSIVSITVSSFGESFVPIDKDGKALSDIALYTDGLGGGEAEFLKHAVPNIGQITGANPNPLYALPKMMWLLKTKPELMRKLWKFLQIADYVTYRLCGEAVLDYSLACRALAFDVRARCWSDKILSAAGLCADMLSLPVPSGSLAGKLHKPLAQLLGLPQNTKIVVGAHDQVASAVGAGALHAGEAVVGTGSVECITPVFYGPILTEAFIAHNYVCIPHATPGNYVTYAFTISGGALLSWYRDRMVPHLKPVAAAGGRSVYDLLNESCPTVSSNVMVVPHFSGTGTPELNQLACGTITGLTMRTGLPEIYRAILEGLCYEMCYNREQLGRFGIAFSSLRATGGGAKSKLWLQLKADILNVPVTPLETADAGAVAGAMLAAVSLGVFGTLEQAAEIFVKTKEPLVPDESLKSMCAEKYERYKGIRQAMLTKGSTL